MSTDWISQQAVHSPDKIAIYFEDQEISYLSYYYHAVAFQNYIEINYPNIEKIGILMESCPEYLYLIMAGMRLQSIIVPLNTRLSTSELQNQIEFLDIKLIFTKNTFNSLISDLNLNIVNIDTIAQSLKFDGIVSINLDYSQIQFIVFTSGSTGKPKGVQISFYNNFYSSIASGLKLGVFSDDNWLLTIPLFHVGGLAIVLRSIIYGTSITILKKFDPLRIEEIVNKYNISLISLIPTMLKRIYNADGLKVKPNSLRGILLSGEKLSPDLISISIQNMIPIYFGYGMTETSSHLVSADIYQLKRFGTTVGQPLSYSKVTIIDKDSNLLIPNKIGEIIVSGPTVTSGYYNHQELFDARQTIHGFMTSDLGYIDNNGNLFVIQRKDDMVVSSGENIYPSEVEDIILTYPEIINVAVFGIPDKFWGEKLIAVIIAKSKIVESTLIDFTKQKLAGYKVPKSFIYVDNFPLTQSGKLNRSELKKQVLSKLKIELD